MQTSANGPNPFSHIDQKLWTAYLQQKQSLNSATCINGSQYFTSEVNDQQVVANKQIPQIQEWHHDRPATSKQWQRTSNFRIPTQSSNQEEHDASMNSSQNKPIRCRQCAQYSSKYNRIISSTSATIRHQENTILELRESHRKQAILISHLQQKINELKDSVNEPNYHYHQQAERGNTAQREPNSSTSNEPENTDRHPPDQRPSETNASQQVALDAFRNISETEQSSTHSLTSKADDLLVECVECGRWVRASSHGDGIAVGYCCSSVLVSTLSDWE